MHIPSFKVLFTSREKLVKTVQALCKEVVSGGSGGGNSGSSSGQKSEVIDEVLYLRN